MDNSDKAQQRITTMRYLVYNREQEVCSSILTITEYGVFLGLHVCYCQHLWGALYAWESAKHPRRTEWVRFMLPSPPDPACSPSRAISLKFLFAYSTRRSAEVVLCDRATFTCDCRSASSRSGSLAPVERAACASDPSPNGDGDVGLLESGGALCTSSGRSAGRGPAFITRDDSWS